MVNNQPVRLFEWVVAFALAGLGVHLLIWPASMQVSAFRFILTLVGEHWLALLYLVAGFSRMAALIANGRWNRHGPFVRAAAAMLAGLLWFQMGLALLRLYLEVGSTPSPGMWVYAALTGGEIYTIYRAVLDGYTRWV